MEETALVFLPLPGAGHLVSSVELAKGLLEKQQCFSITILLMHPHIASTKSAIASTTTSYVQFIAASNPSIRFVDLPLVDFPYENNMNPSTFDTLFVEKHKSHVKEALKRISSSSSSPLTRISAFIIDFFSTTMVDVGKELGISTYIYFPSGAALLGLMLYLPTLDVKVPCEFKDYQGEIEVPGMLPMPPLVMPGPIMDKKIDAYAHFVSHGWRLREADGLITNTFAELELTTLKSRQRQRQRQRERERERDMEETSLVLLPLPGAGHLVSAVELAKRLLEKQQCFSVTILLMHPHIPFMKSAIASSSTSYVQSTAASNPRIHFIDLPLIEFPYGNCNNPSSFIFLYIDNQKPHVKEAIKRRSSSPPTRIVAFIIDFFSTTMIDVGKELGIPTYIYFPAGAAALGLMLYLPTLDVKVPCEFKDYQGEVEVPGMLSLPPLVMPDPIMDKKNDRYSQFVSNGRRFREVVGLIVNTFGELEPTALKSIVNGECLPDHHPTPPVYPVGPLLALDNKSHDPETSQLMGWLDQQPHSSVIFLCFGSRGSFSVPQLKEMALGLEHSGHRFLWSLRCHSSTDPDLKEILPDGFLDRTKGQGLVFQSWAPQVAILGHVAVGGFVSHCGWNSILESIWFGVPILAWPLYAEQKLNAFQLVRDYALAVGLSMDYEKDGWVSAEDLEKGVRSLMGKSEQGQKVRKRAKDMAETSKKAVAQGGSSFSTLELLAKKFML